MMIGPQFARSRSRASRRPVAALIDDQPLSAYQAWIIGVCGLIAMLDGFDTQAIAFVAPAIAASLRFRIETFGPIFATGLFGGLVGAVIFGGVADRFGRRLTILSTLAVIAAGTLWTAQSHSAMQLAALRFLTGVGLGGAIPSIIAISAEYAPRRLRSTLVTAMFCGFPLGAVLGGIGASRLLLSHDWRVLFIVGGGLPAVLFPAVWLALPESIPWLAAHQRLDTIGRILARMNRRDQWDGRAEPGSDMAIIATHSGGAFRGAAGVVRLLEPGRRTGTLLLWCAFFLSLLLVYLLVSWIPTLAQQVDEHAARGPLAAAVLNLSGIAGSICAARFSDRFGTYVTVSACYLAGAAVVMAVGLGMQPERGVYWLAAMAGLFCIGAQLCVVALASEHYPLELRATGVGWAVGVGRVGAMAGPLVGSLLVGAQATHLALFAVIATASAGAGAAILILGRWPRSPPADMAL